MQTSIDSAGRVVIPKAMRDLLGLKGGEQLDITERDGRVVLSPKRADITLMETEAGLVANPDEDLPPLTDDIVRDTLERVRR